MAERDASRLTVLVASVAAIAVLYFARELLIPIALAVVLSFLLTPLVVRLERIGLGRVPSVLLVMSVALGVVGIVGWIAAGQVLQLAEDLPRYRDNIAAKVQMLNTPGTGAIGRATDNLKNLAKDVLGARSSAQTVPEVFIPVADGPVPVEVQPSPTQAFQLWVQSLQPLVSVLGSAAIVIVFVIFILLAREDLRNRFYQLIGQRRINVTTQALDDAGKRVARYLAAQLIVNVCYGLPVMVGLYFIGLPNAVLWGCLGIILRFVPYLGALLTAGVSILISLAVFDGWSGPLQTIIFFVVLELMINNAVEPWLYASRSGMTPVAVLVAVVFWTWLWGAAGLLLAVPLTVCLVVIGRYVPALSFLKVLLGDEQPLTPAAQLYQRLLASDLDESHQIASAYLSKHTLEDLYDDVFIPALILAETDRHAHSLNDQRIDLIRNGVSALIDEAGEMAPRPGDSPASDHQPSRQKSLANPRLTLCVPASDDADAAAATMFVQLALRAGLRVRYVDRDHLLQSLMELVRAEPEPVVCLSVLPPSGMVQMRVLCKRIRAAHPNAAILLGAWGAAGREQFAKRIEGCTVDFIAQNLREAVSWLAGTASSDQVPDAPSPTAREDSQAAPAGPRA